MSAHTITAEFGLGGPMFTMECLAPEGAECRVSFDCDCEQYGEFGDEDGRPYHYVLDYHARERHYGIHDRTGWCRLAEWFNDGDGVDDCRGSVSFTVEGEWRGDHYAWHPARSAT